MANQSLFSMLVRQPWWLSVTFGALLFAALRFIVPEILAFAVALPFLMVALIALWRLLRAPGSGALVRAASELRTISLDTLISVLQSAYSRTGHSVDRLNADYAELELEKKGQRTLVACKRWKVAHTGIAPVRDLHGAMQAHAARHGIYVCAGDFSTQARAYAAQHSITLLDAPALAELLARSKRDS